ARRPSGVEDAVRRLNSKFLCQLSSDGSHGAILSPTLQSTYRASTISGETHSSKRKLSIFSRDRQLNAIRNEGRICGEPFSNTGSSFSRTISSNFDAHSSGTAIAGESSRRKFCCSKSAYG